MRALGSIVTAALVLGSLAGAPRVARAQCPALPGDAFAFLPANPPSDRCRPDPIVRWPNASVPVDCGFFADGVHGLDCGENDQGCVDLCNRAVASWNADLAGHFAFVAPASPIGFCTAGGNDVDGATSVGGSPTVCDGSAFGRNVIAVTFRRTRTDSAHLGQLVDSDITVNSDFEFPPDLFRATVGHELGHVLGLDHPDQCGHDAIVLMRSAFQLPSTDPCFVSEPTSDDITGALMIYPAVAFVCGDADGNGSVTVSDGVQILRAAADLSNTCTLARCDVNGDGTITVSDGVAVLRRAADLPGADDCRQ